MQKPARVWTSMLCWSALAAFVVGCASADLLSRPACGNCDSDYRFVRLQSADNAVRGNDGRGFTHPFTLDRDEWARLLSSIHVRHLRQGVFSAAPEGPLLPMLDAEEIDYLADALSKAFARANERERVVFGLSRSMSPGMTEVTTGGWHRQGQSLHLVLANYRLAITMPNVRERLWTTPLFSSGAPSYQVVSEDYRTVAEQDSSQGASIFGVTVPDLAIDYKALLTAETSQPDGAPERELNRQQHDSSSRMIPLEERLQTLKRLKEQGMITEEEYREKRKRLIDQF